MTRRVYINALKKTQMLNRSSGTPEQLSTCQIHVLCVRRQTEHTPQTSMA